VLFLDLDHFKTINDSHGHAIGDQVLVETARRLQELTRTSDTLARLGGDEFVVLVEDLQEVAESRAIAQRIEDALHLPMVVPPGAEVAVGTSIGITISRPGATPASLLRDADTALYRAKARGRGRHEVFDDHLRSVAAGSQRVEGALRAAIDAGRLVALYQPVVSLRTGRATDAHAQLHICDRRGALIGPADFAEVAGEAGLAPTLDAWLVRRACTDLAGWSNRFGSGDLGVAVTLTGRRWDGDELARAVQSALADSGVAPRQLAVEVDELQLAEAADTLPAVFVRLRSLGVRTAIAGFGQGQSALSELRQLPIDYLKLDPAIVAAAGGPDQAVVSAVAELARALGVPAMADGVATEAQAAALREAGCELALGPRFGCRRRNKDLVLPR
jgi:diguanylate cyclase (GGDEF)-like protein